MSVRMSRTYISQGVDTEELSLLLVEVEAEGAEVEAEGRAGELDSWPSSLSLSSSGRKIGRWYRRSV
jgi:hypothetical protein